jgi:hypothetical protein
VKEPEDFGERLMLGPVIKNITKTVASWILDEVSVPSGHDFLHRALRTKLSEFSVERPPFSSINLVTA